jgi:hypothetical protein
MCGRNGEMSEEVAISTQFKLVEEGDRGSSRPRLMKFMEVM